MSDGHPRQLSASVPAAFARGVRGNRAGRSVLALAPAWTYAPSIPYARRLSPVEPALPRRDRLLGARSESRRMGRAGRRRRRARRQLPVLWPPEPDAGTVPLPLLHVPRDLPARGARSGGPG